jgi:hypothetical protein
MSKTLKSLKKHNFLQTVTVVYKRVKKKKICFSISGLLQPDHGRVILQRDGDVVSEEQPVVRRTVAALLKVDGRRHCQGSGGH